MTVYVGDLFNTPKTRTWPYAQASHMFADSIDELHAFAARLGLKRTWAQLRRVPHYDLTVGKRLSALALGAMTVSRQVEADYGKQFK